MGTGEDRATTTIPVSPPLKVKLAKHKLADGEETWTHLLTRTLDAAEREWARERSQRKLA